MLDDIVFLADYIRKKLPCGVGKKFLPDAHALSERLSHRPSWIAEDDDDHPVPSRRRTVVEGGQAEEKDVPETEEEALDRLGFEGAEREFVLSMKAPKHSMLKHLVAFEEQQRDMLHAIEALNKVRGQAASALERHSARPCVVVFGCGVLKALSSTPLLLPHAPRSARERWRSQRSSS